MKIAHHEQFVFIFHSNSEKKQSHQLGRGGPENECDQIWKLDTVHIFYKTQKELQNKNEGNKNFCTQQYI